MALVKCPECRRVNISDAAATCPSCGYGIKEHFELIRQKEAFDEEKRQKQERLQNELEKELEKIDKSPHPSKPTLLEVITQERGWFAIALSAFTAILGIILIVLSCIAGEFGGIIIYAILIFIFGGVALTGISNIKTRYNALISKYQNWDRYKERLKNDTVERYETWISNLKSKNLKYRKIVFPLKLYLNHNLLISLNALNAVLLI